MGGACSSNRVRDTDAGGSSQGTIPLHASTEVKGKDCNQGVKAVPQPSPIRSPRKSIIEDMTKLAENLITSVNLAAEVNNDSDGKMVSVSKEEERSKGEGEPEYECSPKAPYKPERLEKGQAKTSTTDLRFILAKGDSLNDLGLYSFALLDPDRGRDNLHLMSFKI